MADFGSGHWYTSDGKAKHWQEDGKPTNLRHARKQNLFPSVSAIIGVVAKDWLVIWKVNEHLKRAYSHKPYANESEEDYVKRIKRMVSSDQGETLEFGTKIHAAIETINKHYIDEQESTSK